jgi:hypothetical protein
MDRKIEVKNEEGLLKALRLVLYHKKQMDGELWRSIHVNELGIRRGDSSRENLKKWFIIATGPGWRAGPSPPLNKRRRMLEAFDEWYDKVTNEILQNFSGQEAMDKMLMELTRINGIGPKIAGVYLRDIIYHFEAWPQLKVHLYLPIDRHTRNILTNKLEAFDEQNIPKVGESYFTRKNKLFQKTLDELHKPRVEFDYFWAIGSKFCAFYLCNQCWIQEICKNRSPIILNV